MWSYYGAKTNVVHLYPAPVFDKIIEPFAGTARYALRYFDRDIVLVDKYEVIVKIWKWLQQCSPGDILGLPRRLDPGQTLDDFKFDCEEAKLLMGFLVRKAGERPVIKPTEWVTLQRPNFTNFSLKRIASQLWKIKHWKIECLDYTEIENQKATWFIDPPYEFGGQSYVKSNKKIIFQRLAEWCKERKGQAIVCENHKAAWMDFKPMVLQYGSTGKTNEVIWSNYPTPYDNIQTKLF